MTRLAEAQIDPQVEALRVEVAALRIEVQLLQAKVGEIPEFLKLRLEALEGHARAMSALWERTVQIWAEMSDSQTALKAGQADLAVKVDRLLFLHEPTGA